MSITTGNPTRSTRQSHPARPPRSRPVRFALAAAAGLIATTAVTVGVANLGTGDPARGLGSAPRDHSSQPCRLSETDIANWGETSAHLPQACSDGR